MPNNTIERLIDISESYYLPGGFHGPGHREQVLTNARELFGIVTSHNVEVSQEVVDLGAAWHDAGTAISPSDFEVEDVEGWRPAKHAEEVAAVLFKRSAERLELPFNITRRVYDTILSTHPSVTPKTVESKIVAAADLYNVGFDTFDTFISNTRALWKESQWRGAQSINWQSFVCGSIGYLGLFTKRNIRITSEYFDNEKRSAWHVGATSNILRLAQDALSDTSAELEMPEAESRSIFINISYLDEDGGSKDLRLAVPFTGNVFSVPDESIDTVKLDANLYRKPGIAKEVERVLKGNGVSLTLQPACK